MKLLNEITGMKKIKKIRKKMLIIGWINNYWIENILLNKYVIIG